MRECANIQDAFVQYKGNCLCIVAQAEQDETVNIIMLVVVSGQSATMWYNITVLSLGT